MLENNRIKMNIWRVITAVLLLNILLVEARVITLEEEFISILDDDNKFWELFQNTFKNVSSYYLELCLFFFQ